MWGRRAPAHPPIPDVVPPRETDELLAARRAQNNARNSLLDAVDSGVESRTVTERMHELRALNHFGPDIERAIVGESDP